MAGIGGNDMNRTKSKAVYARSCAVMPGGVNSPVRACQSVGRTPLIVSKAQGSKIIDIDGNEYIDYVGSWGAMILGHAHPEVVHAVAAAANDGTSYGAPTENELILAEFINKAVPSMEMVRLTNSGTEAAMSALRLARGYTGRDLVLKFEGCYHGHSDGLLVKAGSGALTAGIPDSAGVPKGYTMNTLVASYNDCDGIEAVFKAYGKNLAAAIIEPAAANMGVILPHPDFLKLLRELCTQYGALLIFDEVITGFRLTYGGAQQLYKILPDLTVLGKIVGGGLPMGVYGGRQVIMNQVAPVGPVYQAGTLSGNPIATAAGIATLKVIQRTPDFYGRLEGLARDLEQAYRMTAEQFNIPIAVNRIGSLMSVFFNPRNVGDYQGAIQSDADAFRTYFSVMLDNGVSIAPSQYEALFLSYAHDASDLRLTKAAIGEAFSILAKSRT